MNKFTRSFIIVIPVVLLTISALTKLIFTVLRSIIYWAFNWPNYWEINNEWFEIAQEAELWYHYWKTGDS